WDVVDVWAKIRISDLTLVSSVFMSISDVLGNRDSSSDLIGTLSSNVWGIVRMESTTNWSGWEETNLRATVSVLGTTNVTNIGRVSVDLEWFAFRLHDGSHE